MREELRRSGRQVVPDAARSAFAEQHQFPRVPNRQTAQQNGIQQRENRRIGADAERQRKCGHQAESRILRRGGLPPPNAAAARFFISSGEISSMRVERNQRWPKGSSKLPPRSP